MYDKDSGISQWCQLKNLLMFQTLLCYFALENLDDVWMFDFNLKLGQDLADI